uniref:alpha-L-fucosidase n=1 Tax=Bursaphelenchus xylophilus TaxID=6326 RepID=A0A1I7RRA3_BURXY
MASKKSLEINPDHLIMNIFLSTRLIDSPVKDTIVVNDRWGIGVPQHHGSFISGPDKFMPGHLIKKKWESCTTLDRESWGYRRNMRSSDVLTTKEVITLLTQVLAWGGNLLLNIGPDHLGNISPIFEDRLRDIGRFVNANSEAIFETKPWIYQNESETIWYTSKANDLLSGNDYFNPQIEAVTTVYAFLLDWDDTVQLKLIKPTDNIKVTLLGTSITLKTTVKGGVFTVFLPSEKKFPHKDAIVLKIENAKTDKYLPNVHDHF